MAIWQQAVGDVEYNRADICLKYGVILCGNDVPAPWCDHNVVFSKRGLGAGPRISNLTRFNLRMRENDLVVLQISPANVSAVGRIAGPCQWHDEFADLDGWHVPYIRRVNWLWQASSELTWYPGPGTRPLADDLAVSALLSAVMSAPETDSPRNSDLPTVSTDVSRNDIEDLTAGRGFISPMLLPLFDGARDNAYRLPCMSAPEIRTELVEPLLCVLGWEPGDTAIEWHKQDGTPLPGMALQEDDLAQWERSPNPSSIRLIVSIESGDLCNTRSVRRIADVVKYPNCRQVILTDGIRYAIHDRGANGRFQLHAYLNLVRPRREYPLYQCKGAADALLSMSAGQVRKIPSSVDQQ